MNLASYFLLTLGLCKKTKKTIGRKVNEVFTLRSYRKLKEILCFLKIKKPYIEPTSNVRFVEI